MRPFSLVFAALSALAITHASDAPDQIAAKKEEARACVQCHSLRLIHIQRLSAAAWGKELDKMANWGASIPDRKLLLDYLSEEYSDKKPMADPELTADGAKHNP